MLCLFIAQQPQGGAAIRNEIKSRWARTIITLVGGQDNRVSVLSSWDDIVHRYSNLSNFPEKIHVICFDVYMAPDRSLFGS